jgi:hypothetical protein
VSTSEDSGGANVPREIPAISLMGSRAEKLRTLEASIAHLQQLKYLLIGEPLPHSIPSELHGPYLKAPVWPWFVAGWVVGALFVLMFVIARALA